MIENAGAFVFEPTGRPSRHSAAKENLSFHGADWLALFGVEILYDTYLSSLPFYLRIERPIGVVWSGQKSSIMGSFYVAEKAPRPAPGYGQVLYTLDEFSQVWASSGRRVLAFVKEKNLPRLSAHSGIAPTMLFKVGEIVLVTNQNTAGD
jgi:hypothetical protein